MEDYRALLEACTVLGGYGAEFRSMITFAAWSGRQTGRALRTSPRRCFRVRGHDLEVPQARWLASASRRTGSPGSVRLLPPARVLDDVPERPDPFLFHSPRGKPLIKGTHGWSWQKVRARAGVETRWHDLRHFCATQLLELGLSHFDVSIQLGHTDGGALVMERYGHPSVDGAKRRLLGAFEISVPETGSETGSREAAK